MSDQILAILQVDPLFLVEAARTDGTWDVGVRQPGLELGNSYLEKLLWSEAWRVTCLTVSGRSSSIHCILTILLSLTITSPGLSSHSPSLTSHLSPLTFRLAVI